MSAPFCQNISQGFMFAEKHKNTPVRFFFYYMHTDNFPDTVHRPREQNHSLTRRGRCLWVYPYLCVFLKKKNIKYEYDFSFISTHLFYTNRRIAQTRTSDHHRTAQRNGDLLSYDLYLYIIRVC